MSDFKKIRKQFLCAVPLNQINLIDLLKDVSAKNQEQLIKDTVDDELVLKRPIAINYQKAFVKEVMNIFEKQNSVIDDSVYEAYGRLVALPSENLYFKHYLNDFGDIVSLMENVNLISDGTTGLRTWQAAVAFSEWSLQNCNDFADQSVLELGSGIGLTGLTIVNHCGPKKFYFSDCHPSVLSTLCDNVTLNLNPLEPEKKQDYRNKIEDNEVFLMQGDFVNLNSIVVPVGVLNISWEKFDEKTCKKIGNIDKVIATDIVYDSDLFEPLFHALNTLAEYCRVKEFIFCCTERNKETLNSFLMQLLERNFMILHEIQVPKEQHFVWSNETPIRIHAFMKK
ncbi:unnamed protein product [Brassicogethes aeneus]|uniref:FAM86 N-terminal domain-containing protein n=1 Tax=Brassicogethes aeneus TaxID=1431903 RepID=A0A9P0B517_BRAAE|nr:unnamed protein product [Brassicogethes aeneus]